ncbi:hypothetical protein QBC38DRAFT_492765 [Podospora fimiseda]|uniref:C2H2-type domain-containing protein n=1 Tax=Podospora fimiseda TaxID=252190 RepID=A0AAN6YKR0_9PEZI|nr:hypothetical protein QBC38DRAFT_492765 [Podospora fimiseda]
MLTSSSGITINLSVRRGETTGSLEVSVSSEPQSRQQLQTVTMTADVDRGTYRCIFDLKGLPSDSPVYFRIQDLGDCCVIVERKSNNRKRPSSELETLDVEAKRRYSTGLDNESPANESYTCGSVAQPQGIGPQRHQDLDSSNTTLACHLWKHDPNRYQKCSEESFHTMDDVKEHIETAHRREQYCPICYDQFTGPDASKIYREHIIARGCKRRDDPIEIEGLQGDLMDRVCEWEPASTSSVKEQWKEIWTIIFPGVQVPESPLMEG